MEEKKVWDKVNSWSEELDLLKSIISKTELAETTKWGGTVYTFNGKNVIGIGGFRNYFTIWFFNGVFLKDENKCLVNAQEGVTRAFRQWRFKSADEVDEKSILAYINEAINIAIEGKKITPAPKSKNFTLPEILKTALEKENLLAGFMKFAPFKQFEYVEYIDEAKRDATKAARVEKIIPMIQSGVGLNDKYR